MESEVPRTALELEEKDPYPKEAPKLGGAAFGCCLDRIRI